MHIQSATTRSPQASRPFVRPARRRWSIGLAIASLLVAGSWSPQAQAEPPTGAPSTTISATPDAASPAPTVVPANDAPVVAPVPAAAPAQLPVKLVLRLRERRVYVYRGDRAETSYPVAIGKPATPTPTGTYRVFQMVQNPVWKNPWTGQVMRPGPNSALGLRWIGFMERSNGIIGFHGTPTVNSIGRAASNGCVRMRNEHVVELFEKVQMGTTVVVEP